MIRFARGGPTLVDRPHHQALSTAAVTSGEDPLDTGVELAIVGLDVGAGILGEAQLLHSGLFRAEEAHRKQHELRRPDLFAAGHFFHDKATILVFGPLDLDGVQLFQVAVPVTDKALGVDQVDTRVIAKASRGFGLAIVELVDARELWPRIVGGPFFLVILRNSRRTLL